MTAAEDRREELEALLWRESVPAPLVARILAAADVYAKAAARRASRNPAQPGPPKKLPSVHYDARTGRPTCRPGSAVSAWNWHVTADPQAVTCGLCRRMPAWREAAR